MANCSALSNFHNDVFITKDNVYDLRTSTPDTSSGTTVTLSCFDGLELVGDSTVTCNDGSWSYDSKPYCSNPTNSGNTGSTSNELSDDSKIMIGVVAGLAGLIILALILMICCIWYKDRRRRQQNPDLVNDKDRRYGGRDGPATFDRYDDRDRYDSRDRMEMFAALPANRRQWDTMSDRRYYDEDRKTRLSAPMYLPPQDEYRDYYKKKRNYERKRSLDDRYSEHSSKKPYVSEWVSRNSLDKGNQDYDRPSVHGAGRPRRDPYLWRNA